MKTIIIDDNKQAAENLKEKLGRYPEIEVVAIEHSGLDGLASVSESFNQTCSFSTCSCQTFRE